MDETLVIYHRSCADGFAAAWHTQVVIVQREEDPHE